MALTAAEKQMAYRLRQSQTVIDHMKRQDFALVSVPIASWESDARTIRLLQEIADLNDRIAQLIGSPTDLKNIRRAEALVNGKPWRNIAAPGSLLKDRK